MSKIEIPERTVRGMKETLKILVSSTCMLLSNEVFKWPETDYVTYISLQELSSPILKNNPTKKQLMAVLIAWGKFNLSIAQRVPVEELRIKAVALYEQAIEPYQKWFKTEKEIIQ